MRVLLVEDDKDLSAFMQEGLVREGFTVTIARNGKEAVVMAEESQHDVILLDIMMPQMDGYAVLKTLRSKGNKAAVLVVTCKAQERDKLQGLNSGADDYIVKPFLLTELVARIRAVLRRTGSSSQKPSQGSLLKAGDIQLDVLKREVKRAGKVIELTKKEFDLLFYFMQRPGQVLSQTVIAQHISNTDFNTTTNTIEVHIKNLRTKLDGKSSKSVIRTVRGCGYALDI
jgi:DNA-binding response OmpR family regulator